MTKKQKLELTWIGKEKRPKLEPRILLEDSAKSYHAKERVSDDDIFDNRLIFGDNLLALKALEQEFAGKIKCVFIDPPYNTGSAFEHYDDGVEHSIWLGLMRDRLEIIRNLMSDSAVLFVTLDGNEAHYLKVMLDELFGRSNYIGDLIWQKRKGGGNDSRFFAIDHDYVICYCKNSSKEIHKSKWRVSYKEEYLKRYREVDEDGFRYYWDTLNRPGLQNPIVFDLTCPDGTKIKMSSQKSEKTVLEEIKSNRVRISKSKTGWSVQHRVYMPEAGQVLRSILIDCETNKDAFDQQVSLSGKHKAFDYPKPEGLLQKILELCTEKGDLILDSFAGSGTTGAVAHKMGRRWIMVELGEHCHTHIIPRLKKVIDGEDNGGITQSVNWKGGGGFRYYSLAPSLLEKDKWGNWVISKEFNPAQLSQALCKLEGFTYAPSDTLFWQHGHSTETDFIYVTTQSLTSEQLQDLNDQVGPDRSLLVLCSSFKGDADRYPSLTVKKIPRAVLSKCEWGHDDYSLNVQNLPFAEPEPEPIKPTPIQKAKAQPSLFDDNTGEG